ncbi:protein LEG1 homolog [Periophthalmus magnuspinnatus]|uniref:protein LEG1 homolog n=1 Tax=Periophthalmus magnuspinnatus TaxID=409849 RepID=UPI00145A1593|nr:protein LEG1 homolog [Periophthalmus magnuspinnatus]XP_055088044.1 protein LEG1 homolog [Periophthalmus magnuspinnatus]XP_055088045.1 protein LEG1 homolog [Periophthalmus magnuspinnatus]
MRLLLLGLLLVGSCCLSRAGLILENGAPIMWAHATSQPTDLTITEGVLTPDPWHYLHRMSFYRILIAATDPYMTSMGPGDNQSPIWGLPLQLGWMLTSGRLADPTGLTVCGTQGGDTADMCISTNSWWGCVNYFSSALPFLSAAKQGILGDGVSVQMQSPAGVEGYCTTYDSCKTAHPDVINNWDSFFQGLKDATTSPLPENEKKDAILGLYWRAQMSSTAAHSTCQDKLSSYSGVEKSFAHSWLNAAEYVAAAHFQSSLELASQFMSPLPGRILKEDDSPPNIPDLSAEENHSLYIFSWMQSVDNFLGGTLASMWRRAMCSVTTRENGREMLKQLLFNPEYATSSFLSIVTSMSTSCGS